jgi:hypothetical protein
MAARRAGQMVRMTVDGLVDMLVGTMVDMKGVKKAGY